MCTVCGCGDPEAVHEHPQQEPRVVELHEAVMGKNDRFAERNRGFFKGRRVLALNLVSAPGAGKTTLLERTIRDLGKRFEFRVVEGDQATDRDAARIRAAGARAVQVNTGTGCHLDALMVCKALDELDPPPGSIVAIENVGNLVCPALFDLGEHARVVVCSVTEGDDKPIKYPHIFRGSELAVLNKMDLLAHVDFDRARFFGHAREVNAHLTTLSVSARTGEGLTEWYAWIESQLAAIGKAP